MDRGDSLSDTAASLIVKLIVLKIKTSSRDYHVRFKILLLNTTDIFPRRSTRYLRTLLSAYRVLFFTSH